MMYGKKRVTPPMQSPVRRRPRVGDMNEAMGNPMMAMPVTPPKPSPRRRKSEGHNTTLGKYAK